MQMLLKSPKQREPLDGSKSAISEPGAPKTHNEKPAPSAPRENSNNNDDSFTFMDAMKEIKNLFKEFPYLIELGKAFKHAKKHEKVDIFSTNSFTITLDGF
ncbi:hypothetical protein TNCT_707271 [Trichonephila clavata]|uniref:Uncharacterized protein n=1 Tax=Trichonephila clavata TaxID=2740835 RepID=A0A8X6M625_TRICU|nr:hypothetical protein TNCT_707271 [Trichonephila clavata]